MNAPRYRLSHRLSRRLSHPFRHARLLGLVTVLVVGAVSGCSASPPATRKTAGDGQARPGTHPGTRPASDPLRLGIAYGDVLPYLGKARLAAELNDTSYIGGSWIRMDLAWDDVEPVPGPYSWTRIDPVVAAARSRHLSILALLAYTPAFARPRGCDNDKCGPADPAAFAAFAAAAVRRYAPMGVHDWEIWNEPNSAGFWQPAPDPARYAELVRLTAAAIRSVQPQATVVLGSMAAGKLTGIGTPAITFLRALCDAGVNRVVNAIGWHPYSYPALPDSPNVHNPWNLISADSPSFESVLAQAGTPHLPVWITEYGAPTGGPGPPANGPRHPPGVFRAWVTQSFQARLARVAVATAEDNPNIAALLWFTDEDLAGPADKRINFFGLRTVSGAPKPALDALRQAIAGLPGH
jgi:polysaccharide biosynthesis protein PslG